MVNLWPRARAHACTFHLRRTQTSSRSAPWICRTSSTRASRQKDPATTLVPACWPISASSCRASASTHSHSPQSPAAAPARLVSIQIHEPEPCDQCLKRVSFLCPVPWVPRWIHPAGPDAGRVSAAQTGVAAIRPGWRLPADRPIQWVKAARPRGQRSGRPFWRADGHAVREPELACFARGDPGFPWLPESLWRYPAQPVRTYRWFE
jgi:hypothetical protein